MNLWNQSAIFQGSFTTILKKTGFEKIDKNVPNAIFVVKSESGCCLPS